MICNIIYIYLILGEPYMDKTLFVGGLIFFALSYYDFFYISPKKVRILSCIAIIIGFLLLAIEKGWLR